MSFKDTKCFAVANLFKPENKHLTLSQQNQEPVMMPSTVVIAIPNKDYYTCKNMDVKSVCVEYENISMCIFI